MADTLTVRQRLQEKLKGKVSPRFDRFYRYLLEHPVEAAVRTGSDIAEILGMDPATVVRASQNLGYKGWPEMQKGFRALFRDQPSVRKMDHLGKLVMEVVALREELVDPHPKCTCRDCRLARLLDTTIGEIHAQFGKDPSSR